MPDEIFAGVLEYQKPLYKPTTSLSSGAWLKE
jgi:hypothetical protein